MVAPLGIPVVRIWNCIVAPSFTGPVVVLPPTTIVGSTNAATLGPFPIPATCVRRGILTSY